MAHMVLLSQYVNIQAWKSMTHDWDCAQRQGKQVKVDIQVLYAPIEDRVPAAWDVRSTIDDLIYRHTFRAITEAQFMEYDLSEVPDQTLYQIVRDLIAQAAGDNWREAALYAEITKDDHGLIYGRINQSVDKLRSFETDYRMYFVLDELRKRMRKPGQAPWTKAKCALHQDGKFELECEYPDEAKM
jgi:hypothetical protein